jgi:hypothetical protein
LSLTVVVALYLAFGIAYALKVPKWNAPDEPAHFNYVRHVATTATLPVLQQGDYDQAYLARLTAAQFPDSMPIDAVRYEAHQPPLYYLLAAVVYKLTEGFSLDTQVLLLRLFSLSIGSLALIATYAVVREAFPLRPLWALGAAAFAAGVPMHVAMSAAVQNDPLGQLWLSLALLALVGGLRIGFCRARLVVLGLVIGLALLTKVTTYMVLALPLVAFWLRSHRLRQASRSLALQPEGELPRPMAGLVWETDQQDEPGWVRRVVIVYGAAGAVSGWWFLRNAFTYGGFDFFGLTRHDAVVVGQPRTVHDLAGLEYFVTTTFQSFWAQFGWMGVVVDRRIYLALAVLFFWTLAGLAVFAWRQRGEPGGRLAPTERAAIGLLVLSVALVAGALVYYNLTYIQAQGRYLFPAMTAIGLLAIIGFLEIIPRSLAPLATLGLYSCLLALNYLCLVRFIAPYFGTL